MVSLSSIQIENANCRNATSQTWPFQRVGRLLLLPVPVSVAGAPLSRCHCTASSPRAGQCCPRVTKLMLVSPSCIHSLCHYFGGSSLAEGKVQMANKKFRSRTGEKGVQHHWITGILKLNKNTFIKKLNLPVITKALTQWNSVNSSSVVGMDPVSSMWRTPVKALDFLCEIFTAVVDEKRHK